MVPLLDGLLGAAVPIRTWFGALVSIVGVGMLESSGASPRVRVIFIFMFSFIFYSLLR